MTTRQGAPQRTHEHVIAQPHVAAYHAACGLTEPPDRAFLLYLAALTLPAFIAAARSAVPARSHGAGLHVAHEITTAAPITTGTALTTRVSAPTRFGSAGQLIGVESFTDAGGAHLAHQRATFYFRDDTPRARAGETAARAPEPGQLTTRFPPGTAQAYATASGDTIPIHTDAEAARAAGLDRPIAQGLCSLAFVAADIARSQGAAPIDVTALRARFSDVVYWDDTIHTSVTPRGATATFLSATHDGRCVIDQGEMTLG